MKLASGTLLGEDAEKTAREYRRRPKHERLQGHR